MGIKVYRQHRPALFFIASSIFVPSICYIIYSIMISTHLTIFGLERVIPYKMLALFLVFVGEFWVVNKVFSVVETAEEGILIKSLFWIRLIRWEKIEQFGRKKRIVNKDSFLECVPTWDYYVVLNKITGRKVFLVNSVCENSAELRLAILKYYEDLEEVYLDEEVEGENKK